MVREGNERATSTHPTQSEAAETGKDLARRDKSEFFLHAQTDRSGSTAITGKSNLPQMRGSWIRCRGR